MTPDKAALYYLAGTEDACWRWADAGQVLAWPDGTTIAFRPEVEAVLKRLAKDGFPPFAAVVLSLATCRPESLPPGLDHWIPPPRTHTTAWSDWEACVGAYRKIPAEHRLPAKRAWLLEGIFEAVLFRGLPEQARQILDGLATVPPDDLCEMMPSAAKRVDIPQALWLLRTALESFDAQAWETRNRTGVDEPPGRAPVEIPDGQQVRELLDELRDDRELSGLAALAKHLLAAVSVPRPVSARDELPVGGISDLTNRGSLDRLVLSELAHDDLTLAVRVALNEALYWRRESPPRNPPALRAVLVDIGLRLWGLPRMFAFAVAMALAATADPQASVRAYAAAADGASPIDLKTRKGLLDALEQLSAAIHPGIALREFVQKLDRDDQVSEPILVTSDDTFDDPAFQNALAELQRPLLVATVSRDGDYLLWAARTRERREINRATLDLSILFRRPETLRVESAADGLPLIFSQPEFPLRLPHPRVESGRMKCLPGRGILAATNDGRLMLWDHPGWGAVQLHDRLPGKNPLLISGAGGRPSVLHAGTGNVSARLFSVVDGRPAVFELADVTPGTMAAVEHAGMFYVWNEETIQVLDGDGGHVLSTQPLSRGLHWRNGRFFKRDDGTWLAAAFDGRQIIFTEIPGSTVVGPLLAVLDVDGVDGPVGLQWNGNMLELFQFNPGPTGHYQDRKINLGSWFPELRLRGASHDGRRVWLSSGNSSNMAIVDLIEGRVATRITGDLWPHLEPTYAPYVRETSLRVHFQSVHVEDTRVCLRTKSGALLRVALDAANRQIVFRPDGRSDWPFVNFSPHRGAPGARYSLQMAQMPGGARVFCDSRGLLHLCPREPGEADLCLVLSSEGPLAGWNSEGGVHGSPYFIGDRPAEDFDRFYARISRFTGR